MDGFCIEICVTPQGITVESGPLDDMQGEQGEPVESIDAALERARALFDEKQGAPVEQQAENDFTSGFA